MMTRMTSVAVLLQHAGTVKETKGVIARPESHCEGCIVGCSTSCQGSSKGCKAGSSRLGHGDCQL